MSAVAVEHQRLLPATMTMNGILQKSLNLRDDGCCLQHPHVTVFEADAGRLGQCHLCGQQQNQLGDTYTTLSSSFLFTGESAASLLSSTHQSPSSRPVPQQQQEKRSVGERKEQPQPSSAEESSQTQEQILLESILARWMQVQNQAIMKGRNESQQQQHLPRSLMALATPLILNDLRQLASKVEGQQRIISNQSIQIQELKESLEEKHATTQDLLQTILQQVTKQAASSSTTAKLAPPSQKSKKISKVATSSVAASMASSSCPPLANFSVTSVTATSTGNNNNNMVVAAAGGGSKSNSKKSKEGYYRAAPNSRRKLKRGPSASSKRSVDSSIQTPLTRHDSNKSFTLSELRMVTPKSQQQQSTKPSSTVKSHQDTSKPREIEFSSPLAVPKTATNKKSDCDTNESNLEGSLNFSTLLTPMGNPIHTTTPIMTDHSSRSRDITLDGSHHSLEHHRDRDMPDLGAIFEDGLGDDMKSVKRKKFNLPANFGRKVEPMEIILEATLSGRHITSRNSAGGNHNNKNSSSNNGGTASGGQTSSNNNSSHISSQHRRKLLPTSPEDVGLANDVDVTPHKYKIGKTKTKNISTNKMSNNNMAVVGHSSLQVFPTQEKVDVDVGLSGHMSLLMLDNRSASPDHDSDLSESIDSDEEDETYFDDDDDDLASYDQETLDDTATNNNSEPNDYSIENLKHEAGLEMIDMYGDRGTYSGTVAPDGDPTGFGTMKYDSGRFFKGKVADHEILFYDTKCHFFLFTSL